MVERKSILLTYGEMKDASKSDGYTGVARAQLKKVVELLGNDYILAHDVKSWSALGRECEKDCRACAIWQALLKECE